MDKREQETKPGPEQEQDFRHLPPRITPEEMVPVQPVVQAVHDPMNGDIDDWHVRQGWAI
ncbi:hypothetical protein [Couchioplanes azureus]|uniref:hypothetical protein n=1 Tax=Couchioplanes caeruleus TaxID=56438 RepID=UPI0016709799|nr:hypothetical protein [Couchioplanes caeruleus]GGQ60002.1 hypothetical protein GCM10010166_32010 [Couchioplanes caeruleus subsp. azureus]